MTCSSGLLPDTHDGSGPLCFVTERFVEAERRYELSCGRDMWTPTRRSVSQGLSRRVRHRAREDGHYLRTL